MADALAPDILDATKMALVARRPYASLLPHLRALLWSALMYLALKSAGGEALRPHRRSYTLSTILNEGQASFTAAGAGGSRAQQTTTVPSPTGYLPSGVTRQLLVSWALDEKQMGMPPGSPVMYERCGSLPEARLAMPKTARTVGEATAAYMTQVRLHQEARRGLRQTLQISRTTAVRLLFLQWNTEDSMPTPWEALQTVIPTNGSKPDIDTLDGFVIALQEIPRALPEQYGSFIENVVLGMNALSQQPTWSVASSGHTQLENLLGTKATKMGPWANTQALIFVGRQHINPKSIGYCQWSWRRREKGFVGVSATIGWEGNNVLILGTHLVTAKEEQSSYLHQMLYQALQRCVPPSRRDLGFDHFSGGVFLLGDMNSRLSEKQTASLMADAALNPLFQEIKEVIPEPGQSVTQARLLHMLGAPLREKVLKYFPVLYAVDTLGGSPPDDRRNDLVSPLLSFGFSIVSVCYTGLVSYKWTKNCPLEAGESQLRLENRCLDTASKQKAAHVGFLDRLVIRRASVVGPCKGLTCSTTPAETFIYSSGELMNLRGDHLPQVFVTESWPQRGLLKREASAPLLS